MIRPAEEDDISRILEIEREAISPPWSHGGLLGEIYSNDTFFALAVMEKTVLGFVILRCSADESELYQIAVDASHRRRGIADMLMKAAMDHSRSCGQLAIYLEVRKSNEAAMNLYKKHGFKKTGQRKGYYTEPTEDAVIMSLEIKER